MPTIIVQITNSPPINGANSYVDNAFCDSYFSERNVTEWTTYTEEEQDYAILDAGRALNIKYNYRGVISSSSQSMLFPRGPFQDGNGRYVGFQTIPLELKNAQCELAWLSITGTDLYVDAAASENNVKSFSETTANGAFAESKTYYSPSSSSTYTVPTAIIQPLLTGTRYSSNALRG